jgi:CheY-like chemotaxis protein/HPt (histidine-containing phosphotransfer) domain-containing protein
MVLAKSAEAWHLHSQPIVTRHALRAQRARIRDRILLAEDNAVNQKVAMRLLENLDYRVDVVPNGRAAVNAWQHGKYDLILMDCQMPELDGYAATREIRRLENGKAHIPIIALTAHAVKGADAECFAAGMDDYLTKPIDKNKLDECLERHLAEPDTDRLSTTQTSASAGSADDSGREAPIDWAALLVGIDGDVAVVREFAALFADLGSNTLPLLMDAIDRGDFKSVAHRAHEIKGACANLKANAAAKFAERLEGAVATSQPHEIKELASDLAREVRTAIDFLAAKVA